ncbi:MAG: DUF445 family protein [Acidobacteria bacterium]|nr:DUF445 family protein [Acidobacteriota bacterium]MBI3422023.1 DUF445 family protein [Acidobacteriota bacterium]
MNVELLVKLSPVVVATLHGYGAAWLAVRMLFRPRQPHYIFGWQIPLTPGMLPKERARFIVALSGAIAERLLNIEVIAAELTKLDLESEIAALAQREYTSFTSNETALQAITEHMRERLIQLSQAEEPKQAIVRQLRGMIDRQTATAGFVRRLAAEYLLDQETLYALVGRALEGLADGIAESSYVRHTVSEALAQMPQKLLKGNRLVSSSAIADLVETLSRKLDVRAILMNRLNAFSNEDMENLVMETAGREIKAIVWFGAGIGLVVGVLQTALNFVW